MNTIYTILVIITSLIILAGILIFMFMYNLRHHDDESTKEMSKKINKVRKSK